MKLVHALCGSIALLALACLNVRALDAVITGAQVDCDYQEPGANADGTGLLDLAYTNVHYKTAAGELVGSTVTATNAKGGGVVTSRVNLPLALFPAGKELKIELWATAVDDDGNRSVRSSTAAVVFDRLAPGAPK